MKLKTHSQFEKIKKGQWLEDCDGIYEVISEYNSFHGTIGLAEVYHEIDENGFGTDEYHLEDERPYVTFDDVRGCEVY